MKPTISIIICTCNRAKDLGHTLEVLGNLSLPSGLTTELLIVDNGSTDSTKEVVDKASFADLPVRYVLEPRAGQCFARNAGIAEASGDILLFTDDDVRPPANWISCMCGPILRGEAQAVVGNVHLAPHLKRDWMQGLHYGWLANVEYAPGEQCYVVGANMAFAKSVLDKIEGFDTELGPGARGYGDDGLFGLQLKEAGYRIVSAPVSVEHHFQESRLRRDSFLNAAVKHGRTGAYLAHHWQHMPVTFPLLREWKHIAELTLRRTLNWRECQQTEGAPVWELELVKEITFFREYVKERQTPRSYEKLGLNKKPSVNQ